MSTEQQNNNPNKEAMPHTTSTGGKRVTIPVPGNRTVAAIVVIALCVVSFYGGVIAQKHHDRNTSATTTAGQRGRMMDGYGGFGRPGGRRMGGIGTVKTVSSTSITVTNDRTATDKTYTINSSTTATNNGATVDVTTIKAGDTVLITPSTTDSTVAARIVVNPAFGPDQMPAAQDQSSSQTQTN